MRVERFVILTAIFAFGISAVIRYYPRSESRILTPDQAAEAYKEYQEKIKIEAEDWERKRDERIAHNRIERINSQLKNHDFTKESELTIDLYDTWTQGTDDINVEITGYDEDSEGARFIVFNELVDAGWLIDVRDPEDGRYQYIISRSTNPLSRKNPANPSTPDQSPQLAEQIQPDPDSP